MQNTKQSGILSVNSLHLHCAHVHGADFFFKLIYSAKPD